MSRVAHDLVHRQLELTDKTFGFAVGLGVVGSTGEVLHSMFPEEFLSLSRDKLRTIVRHQCGGTAIGAEQLIK